MLRIFIIILQNIFQKLAVKLKLHAFLIKDNLPEIVPASESVVSPSLKQFDCFKTQDPFRMIHYAKRFALNEKN